jgi:urease accessory protein
VVKAAREHHRAVVDVADAVDLDPAALRAGVALDDARELLMYTTQRSALSAAIRLGVVGPLRAQHLLLAAAPTAARALTETAALGIDDACSAAPMVELAQASHDRLEVRLFQS